MENAEHRPDNQQRASLPNLLFIIAVLLGLFIRWKLNSEKILLEYDDAITLLAATGHEGEYAQISSTRSYPIGAWAPAGEWLRLVQPEPGRGLRQVAADLATYDIHPPLYFWALHGWVTAFGTRLTALQGFNFFLELLILVTLVWVGRRVLRPPSAGFLLAATWFQSPIAAKTAFWVRQYTFFGLVLLVFFYLLFRFSHQDGRPRLLSLQGLGLAIAILAGIFTHYYFLIFLACGLALAVLPALWRGRRRMVPLFAGLFVVAFLLLLAYPGFSQSIQTYLDKWIRSNGDPTALAGRVQNAAKTLSLLYSPVLLGLALAVIGGWDRRRKEPVSQVAEMNTSRYPFVAHPVGLWAAVFAILPLLAILALYLLGLSPGHAFSSRYLGFFSPLVAILPVLFIFQSRQGERLVPSYYASLFVLGLLALLPGLTQSQEGWLDRVSLNAERYVVIDSIQWGTWPGIALNLDGGQEIFGDGQEQLLANPEDWIERPGSQGFIYVSIVRGKENTSTGRDEILTLLGGRYKVEELSEAYRPQDWSMRLYRVRPAP